MRVMVTGAHGQVGRALVSSVPTGVSVRGFAHQELDIGDPAAVSAAVNDLKPDVIINAAAYTAVDRAESEQALAERVNADGPRSLAQAARTSGARLIHISTDFVFDGQSSIAYTPESRTNPLNVYGLTKRRGEEGVLELLRDRSVVLRTSWVYSAQGSNFLLTMLRIMKANGSVRVVSDQIGTPTSAASVSEVIWKLVSASHVSGIQHWSDAGVASWYDFAVAIAEEAAQMGLLSPEVRVIPISSSEYPTAARRPFFSVLDKRSLCELLEITPRHWRVNLRSVLRELPNA